MRRAANTAGRERKDPGWPASFLDSKGLGCYSVEVFFIFFSIALAKSSDLA